MLKHEVGLVDYRNFETAVRYQLWHSMAMVLAGLVSAIDPKRRAARWSAVAFLTGTGLFSGGIYAGIITGAKGWDYVVPFGGTLLIVAWALLAVAGFRLASPRAHREKACGSAENAEETGESTTPR
ncbi:MAG: DUF423 domain-containing protein [Planctomycetota bacterium]|nr:MAG: DUF423 domain-containing protein [Planctomycetota bacterium]